RSARSANRCPCNGGHPSKPSGEWTVQLCRSGASSRKRPRRLAPSGGSLQAGPSSDFSPSTHLRLIKLSLLYHAAAVKSSAFFAVPARRPPRQQPKQDRFVKFALKQSPPACKNRAVCCTIRVDRVEMRACAQKAQKIEGK